MKDNKEYRIKIENYIQAYNSFNVDGMLRDLHKDIHFKNIADGDVNLSTEGIEAFKKQAEIAKDIFREREQRIDTMKFNGDTVKVAIDYTGTLAKDLPNGLKAGETLHLKGKSTFVFKDDKILSITDIS